MSKRSLRKRGIKRKQVKEAREKRGRRGKTKSRKMSHMCQGKKGLRVRR